MLTQTTQRMAVNGQSLDLYPAPEAARHHKRRTWSASADGGQPHCSQESSSFLSSQTPLPQIMVHIQNPEVQDALCDMLRTWLKLFCVCMEVIPLEGSMVPQTPAVVFWDLDGSNAPPAVCQQSNCALILCSRDSRQAIRSYSFHPDGFLTIPLSMEKVCEAMLRCARRWGPFLKRLDVVSERAKIGIPLQNLLWIEGSRRGCTLHTSHRSINAREPLYQLEQRLPSEVFTRCQRSFVVNLNYVQEMTGDSLLMRNGVKLSLSRRSKDDVAAAYQYYCQLRSSSRE